MSNDSLLLLLKLLDEELCDFVEDETIGKIFWPILEDPHLVELMKGTDFLRIIATEQLAYCYTKEHLMALIELIPNNMIEQAIEDTDDEKITNWYHELQM